MNHLIQHFSLHLLTSMDNIDSESVDCIPADIIPVHPGDEHLPLVVVAEEAADHGEVRRGARHDESQVVPIPSAPRSMTSAAPAALVCKVTKPLSVKLTSINILDESCQSLPILSILANPCPPCPSLQILNILANSANPRETVQY